MPARSSWHGYILLRKPWQVSEVEWGMVIQYLRRELEARAGSSRPNWRLHWRLSLDGHKVIMEGMFDLADLDPADLARFCRYVSEALDGRLAPGEVRSVFGDSVRVFCQGEGWQRSNSAVRSYISVDKATWEEA